MSDSPRTRRWRIGIGAGALLVALVAALAVARARDGETVAVIGDSITAESVEAVRGELGDHDVSVRAIAGMRTDQMQLEAERAAAAHPAQVIINLGTNDVLQGRSTEDIISDLVAMITTFARSQCVHVVNLNTRMVSAPQVDPDRIRQVNLAVQELASADPRINEIDWNQIVESSNDSAGPRDRHRRLDTSQPERPDGAGEGVRGRSTHVHRWVNTLITSGLAH